MGKCPAPCDGTISMDDYRKGVERSALTILNPNTYASEASARMQELAQQLQFEQAGKIKLKLDQVNQFGKTAFRYARRIEEFRFVSLQRGPRDRCAKIFLVTPCAIEEVAALVDEPQSTSDLLRYILDRAQCRRSDLLDDPSIERIGLVAHHLFSAVIPRAFSSASKSSKRNPCFALPRARPPEGPRRRRGRGCPQGIAGHVGWARPTKTPSATSTAEIRPKLSIMPRALRLESVWPTIALFESRR